MNFTRNSSFSQILANIRTILKINFNGKIIIPVVTKSVSISPQFKSIIKIKQNYYNNSGRIFIPISILFSGLPFFNNADDEETPEQKLINTIKRSILCIQREEYDKAERMLHLSLRMAQDLKHTDGITYIYDLMANLAMEQEQFQKAEKLFADVMKRLFADGLKETDTKMLHISLKMAHMAHLQENLDKAKQGFEWTLEKIDEKKKELPDDQDIKELWGVAQNWYAQSLMDENKYKEAKQSFLNAYDVYTAKYGKINEEAVTILNNISVACAKLGDTKSARIYLEEAIATANQLPSYFETGVLQANLGLLYIQDGFNDLAREACSKAWKIGKKNNHEPTIKEAEKCLEKVNALKV